MKKILGLLMVVGLLVSFVGCGGDKDSPTGPSEEITKGPQGQTIEVWTEKYDNGDVKVEYQYFRDGEGKVVKHGYYKVYGGDGNLFDEDAYREGSCVESCEWRKTFGGGKGKTVQQMVDGGFIVTGRGWVADDDAALLLLKTDGQGNEEWRKTFGDGEGFSVQQTVDGGFIVTGDDDDDGGGDVLLLKTDGQGNEEWRKTFGDGEGFSVQQTVDGGFIVTGYEEDEGEEEVFLLFKTDGQGNEEWRKTFGEGYGSGNSVQQTVDGGFVVTGRDGYDLFLLKTNELGNIDLDLEDD